MQIVFVFEGNVNEYQTNYDQLDVLRPEQCPNCMMPGTLIGNGNYWRKPRDEVQVYRIQIRRWLCKACDKTVSLLPNFVFCGRWYLVETVSRVLESRFVNNASWQGMIDMQGEYPHLRTMQRWCSSFQQLALVWLLWIAKVLAEQDIQSEWLEAGGGSNDAEKLLEAAMHLLAWAKSRWRELGKYGFKDWLHFLWVWGWQQGLGRPV